MMNYGNISRFSPQDELDLDMSPIPLDDFDQTWDVKIGNMMDRILRRIFVCLGLLDP